MNDFEEKISSDLDWRLGEIALLKSLTIQTHLTENKRKIARKYTVPAFYAIWEGFVSGSLKEVIYIINHEKLSVQKINNNILTKHVFSKLNLQDIPRDFKKKVGLVEKAKNMISEPILLTEKINTGANIDYDRLCMIFEDYGIDQRDLYKYKSKLNKFINYRNKIAHGDNSVIVEEEDISEFSQTIIGLMAETSEIIVDYINSKKYLK